MKAKIFYTIMRVKDEMYFHETDEHGQHWFVSAVTQAYRFHTREEAWAKIRFMQNWLKRPKFRVMTGKIIART